jgi:hypothetical protein
MRRPNQGGNCGLTMVVSAYNSNRKDTAHTHETQSRSTPTSHLATTHPTATTHNLRIHTTPDHQ